jgi:hypothetical protein
MHELRLHTKFDNLSRDHVKRRSCFAAMTLVTICSLDMKSSLSAVASQPSLFHGLFRLLVIRQVNESMSRHCLTFLLRCASFDIHRLCLPWNSMDRVDNYFFGKLHGTLSLVVAPNQRLMYSTNGLSRTQIRCEGGTSNPMSYLSHGDDCHYSLRPRIADTES